MNLERLAQEILRQLDDAGRDLTIGEWVELCDEVAGGAAGRAEAGRDDLKLQRKEG